MLPADNPWNADISSLPVDSNSAAYITSINAGATMLHPDFGSDPSYGIPYVVVPGTQPKVPITFTAYSDESDPGPYPIPANAAVEAGSDRHVLVLDSGACRLYEMFDAQLPPMGLRLRLRASFDISRFTGEARIILVALQRYGLIVADNGTSWYVTGATDSRWNDTDLDQLKTVPGSAFEAVQTGPVLHQ